MSKIAKFDGGMLSSVGKITVRSFQIFYMIVDYMILAETYKIYKLCKTIFAILQNFATKLYNFTNFVMFFLAVLVVADSFFFK